MAAKTIHGSKWQKDNSVAGTSHPYRTRRWCRNRSMAPARFEWLKCTNEETQPKEEILVDHKPFGFLRP